MREETVIDKIEILEYGNIQVRRATYLVRDDGTRALLGYHRVGYDPSVIDDPDPARRHSIDDEDARVKAVALLEWTPAVVAAHADRQAERE
jgi:hypothetical protein|tara:strand:- start:557 stop:829 length:273 start_codon:yes stop_codon:yes gene_type:complete